MSPYDKYKPDWAFWRRLPAVAVWEAVALSWNIDPRYLIPHPSGCGSAGVAVSVIPPLGFDERLDLANRCIGGETLPAVQILPGGEPKVTLQAFTRWAIDIGWLVPQELVELAGYNLQTNKSADHGVRYQTGMAGKPSSWHLLESEVRRRHANGERHPSIAVWARELSAWLQSEHPLAARPKLKTLTNNLSRLFREMKANPRE
jgi:hypothetical protein